VDDLIAFANLTVDWGLDLTVGELLTLYSGVIRHVVDREELGAVIRSVSRELDIDPSRCAQLARLQVLKAQGRSVREVAKLTGLSRSTVARRWAEAVMA
jgi:hypothetical protein